MSNSAINQDVDSDNINKQNKENDDNDDSSSSSCNKNRLIISYVNDIKYRSELFKYYKIKFRALATTNCSEKGGTISSKMQSIYSEREKQNSCSLPLDENTSSIVIKIFGKRLFQ